MLRTKEWSPEEFQRALATLGQILGRSTTRGRDSWGITAIYDSKRTEEMRITACYDSSDFDRFCKHLVTLWELTSDMPRQFIENHRAEPTTEAVIDKSRYDVQPFRRGGWFVVHNGTIANDVEILASLAPLSTAIGSTKIDTYAIARLLEEKMLASATITEMVDLLHSSVKGSYAFLFVNMELPGTAWLIANYKPLHILHDEELGAYFYTSLEDSFVDGVLPGLTSYVQQVPPYSIVKLSAAIGGKPKSCKVTIETSSLRANPKQKALVVCSGGLDSTVAAMYLYKRGYEVGLLHFRYGCVAESREVSAVSALAALLHAPLFYISVPDFKETIGGSTLFQDQATYTSEKAGMSGAEFAYEWVPARNLVFLSLAVALAEAKGYDFVASGVNLEEAGAYPDNEMIFIQKLNAVLPYATHPDRQVHLLMPTGNLMKREIVQMGLEYGAPIQHSWSCYSEGKDGHHCGTCGPCYMRKTAFKLAGVKDPAFIHEWEDSFWDGCTPYVYPVSTELIA